MAIETIVLRVERQEAEVVEHLCSDAAVVVGRSSSSDLVIPDPYLSRRHARFSKRDDGWYVEDLSGRSRTLLNGVVVAQPARLSFGDVVKLSDTVVRIAAPSDSGSGSEQVPTPAPSDAGTLFRPASALIERTERIDPALGGDRLARQTDRLRVLNSVHRALAGPITLEALLELILDRIFAELLPDEAVVFLKDGRGDFYRAATRRVPGIAGDYLYSRRLVQEVSEKQLAALVLDASSDERFSASESMMASGVRSLLAAPLLDPSGCPGMIVISSRAQVRSFSEDDMELLVSLASAAAMRMRNIALAEESARRRALEKELDLARQIQMALLPTTLPSVHGYELRGFSGPSRTVSGDLYQVQMRQDDRECVILLADVSGKGMAAALLTASLEALAIGPIEVGHPPEGILARLSRRLFARTAAERYATAFVAVLDAELGSLRYANAGHNPSLLMRADGNCQRLGATGIPLGLLPIAEYEGQDLALAPGDTLLVYTDGLSEAANPEGEEYGVERLEAVLRRNLTEPLEKLANDVEGDIEAFARGEPYADDRTFVLLRRTRLP